MPATLPPEFWAREADVLRELLLPLVRSTIMSGVKDASDLVRSGGLWLDESLVNAEASRWARSYTDDLLNTLGTTDKKIVGEAIARWAETPGATIGELRRELTDSLGGVVRAASTAVTETTRAYAQGNIISFTGAGAIPPPMWTGPDGISRPYGPPGHPRCRCRNAFKRLPDGTLLVVWLTLRDDLVCTRKFGTPWGVADGCRAMNGVCISASPEYGGKRV